MDCHRKFTAVAAYSFTGAAGAIEVENNGSAEVFWNEIHGFAFNEGEITGPGTTWPSNFFRYLTIIKPGRLASTNFRS
jgi:hypothetical protein